MRQRDLQGGYIHICGGGSGGCGGCEVPLDKQRIPKFNAANCASPKCFRLCLTHYCAEHYPQLDVCEDLALFLEISQACSVLYGKSDARYAKAIINFFDCATTCWDRLPSDECRDVVRRLLESPDFHPGACKCGEDESEGALCDLAKRYAFMMLPKDEMRPAVISKLV